MAGYAHGGLITIYGLFQAPDLFSNYLAGSPTLLDQVFDHEESYASAHDNLDHRVILTAGSMEIDLLPRLEIFLEQLRLREYPGLDLEY